MILGKYIGSLFAIGIALVSTDCNEPSAMTPCTPSIEPAVTVTVSDAQTQVPLEAKVVVRDDNFQEELKLKGVTAAGQIIYGGAFERPGSYTVSTSKDGYETSILEKIEVVKGECHVRTRNVQVKLKLVNNRSK